MRRVACFALAVATCLPLAGCKLPYRTRPQVLVVPYRNLVPEGPGTGDKAAVPSCLRAPLTDLPVPPETVQFQVKSAVMRLEIRNEGGVRLHVYPYLSERGVDAYAGQGLAPDAPLDLAIRGATVERTFAVVPALFRAQTWSFGLRVTGPNPFEPASRGREEKLEVRWQLEVDAALI